MTDIDICNMALRKLGADTITALTDNVKEAEACADMWTQVRKTVFSAFPWPSCVTRATLECSCDCIPFGWTNSFPLPDDFVALMEVYGVSPNGLPEYEIEDGKILCNDESLSIRYIYDNRTPNTYEPLLVDCLVLRLASEIAYSLVAKESVENSMLQKYHMKLNEARTRISRVRTNEPNGIDYLVIERY